MRSKRNIHRRYERWPNYAGPWIAQGIRFAARRDTISSDDHFG
jgi:hypothetical protein